MTTMYIMELVVGFLLSNDARRSSFNNRLTSCGTASLAQNLVRGVAHGSATGTARSHVWGARRTATGEDRKGVYMNFSVPDARGKVYTMQVDVINGKEGAVVASLRADVVRRLGAERVHWVQMGARGRDGDKKKESNNEQRRA